MNQYLSFINLPCIQLAHPDQANQISGHHTITKEWSDVWVKAPSPQPRHFFFIEKKKKHIRGQEEERKGSIFKKLDASIRTDIGYFVFRRLKFRAGLSVHSIYGVTNGRNEYSVLVTESSQS